MSNSNQKKSVRITILLSILALILSGITFWYTFLRPSELFVSLPPNILLQKISLTTHDVTKELPCIVMAISSTAFGPKSVNIEDILIELENKGNVFYFSPKRELVEFIIPNEAKSIDEAPEPEATIMKPIYLSPNSSHVAYYVFTPYDDHWNPYPCLGEIELSLFVRTNGEWIQKDEKIYINTRANWESMRGFAIVSYSDRESSIKSLSEK